MSIKDLPFVTVEQVVILRQAAIELEQRAEAAEAKLREFERQEPVAWMQDLSSINDKFYIIHPNPAKKPMSLWTVPLYAKPFLAPKQEEK